MGRKPVTRGLLFIDPHGHTAMELARLNIMQDGLVLVDPRSSGGSCPVINPFDRSFKTLQEQHLYADALSDAFVSMMSKEEEGLSLNMRMFLTPCLTLLLLRPGSTFYDLRRLLSGDERGDLLRFAQSVGYLQAFFSEYQSEQHELIR